MVWSVNCDGISKLGRWQPTFQENIFHLECVTHASFQKVVGRTSTKSVPQIYTSIYSAGLRRNRQFLTECLSLWEHSTDRLHRNNKWLTCRLVLGSLAIRWPPRSKSRTCLLSWGIATTPVFETARRFAAESDRIVASDDRMLRRSHTLTLRSSEPDTTLSSLVNTAHVTVLQ